MVEWVLSDKQMEYIDCEDPEILIEGSAGSGKSIFAVVKCIKYCLEFDGARAYVFRMSLPDLKRTLIKEFRQLLTKFGIEFRENKTDGVMEFPNGSLIQFTGLEDFAKIRSINADFVIIEQCEQLPSYEVYSEIKLRVRNTVSQKYYPQLIAIAQPEGTKEHWVYKYFHTQGYGKILFFSYKDNPFLPEAHRNYYESLKDIDPDLYRKYTLGLWGGSSKAIYTVYDNQERDFFDYYTLGLDFGYNNPSAAILVGWYDDEAYIIDEVYKSQLLSEEFIDLVKIMLDRNEIGVHRLSMVYGDSAAPEAIEKFSRAGFPIVKANKDVMAGIETVKHTKLHIKKSCKNTLEEIANYEWQVDKEGTVTDKPLKVKDHLMDALRYTVYGVRGFLSDSNFVDEVGVEDIFTY